MKKNVLTIMSALILVCCFFIYHFSKELLIQNSHQVPQSQINKKISAERNTQQNKIYRVMININRCIGCITSSSCWAMSSRRRRPR
jgi:hypothetical protein